MLFRWLFRFAAGVVVVEGVGRGCGPLTHSRKVNNCKSVKCVKPTEMGEKQSKLSPPLGAPCTPPLPSPLPLPGLAIVVAALRLSFALMDVKPHCVRSCVSVY